MAIRHNTPLGHRLCTSRRTGTRRTINSIDRADTNIHKPDTPQRLIGFNRIGHRLSANPTGGGAARATGPGRELPGEI